MTQPVSNQHNNNRARQSASAMKDDGELSFEDLTFGDSGDNHSHESGSPNGNRPTSPTAPATPSSVSGPHSPRAKSKKQPVDSKKPQLSMQDVDRNSVFVSFADPSKVHITPLLRQMETFGAVEAYYFKDKQNHGFVHFADTEAADAAVAYFHNSLFEGCHIAVEHATRAPMQGTPQSAPTGTPSSLPNGSAGPEKPDTILVLKNLPFHLKQEQLSDILLHILSTQPQSINLHFDNLGVFRGMAFVKYHKLDDAIVVYEALNGYDVSGRKVRVEYKRKPSTKVGEVPIEWQEEGELHDLWERVKIFRDAPDAQELPLPSLTSIQRKQIHSMADKLKLIHFSTGEGDARCLFLSKKSQPPTTSSASSSYNKHDDNKARAIEIKGRRRGDTDSKVVSPQGSVENQSSSFGRSRYGSSGSSFGNKFSASAPDHDGGSGSWRNTFHHNTAAAMGTTPTTPSTTPSSSYTSSQPSSSLPAYSAIQPCRQPRGPDGSSGFGDGYKSGRKSRSESMSAAAPPAHTVVKPAVTAHQPSAAAEVQPTKA